MNPDEETWQLDRLSAEEAPELHRALGIAKQRLPSASELSTLAASLSAHGVPLGKTVPSGPAANATSHVGKYWVVIGGALLGATALVAIGQRGTRAERPTPHAAALASTQAKPASTAPPRESAVPAPVIAPADVKKAVTPPAPLEQPDAALSADSAPALSGAPPGSAIRSRVPHAATAPTAEPNRPPRSDPQTRSDTESALPELRARPLPSEIELLREARHALQSSPALALGLTEQHSARFPRGTLTQERELIAISALARLGRRAAVLSRAQRFDHDFPGSPYRKQIAELAR